MIIQYQKSNLSLTVRALFKSDEREIERSDYTHLISYQELGYNQSTK